MLSCNVNHYNNKNKKKRKLEVKINIADFRILDKAVIKKLQ